MSGAHPAGLTAILETLRQRNYRRYVAGNSVSLIGNWMQRTAIGWLAWDLTGSTTWLGIIAFADLAPAILVGPFGGVMADRVARQRIIMHVQSIMLALSLLLAVLAWTDLLNRWSLLAVTIVHGTMVGLNQPARLALVSSLTRVELLGTAVALNSIVFNTARFLGPAIAGILLTFAGVGWTFFVNSLTYVGLIWALACLDLPPAKNRIGQPSSVLRSIAEGVQFLVKEPYLGPVMALVLAFGLLVRPLGELLPAFADGIFNQGASGLAWLSGALGFGAAIGGFWLASHPGTLNVKTYVGWLGAGMIATAIFVIAQPFAMAALAVGVCGFCFVVAGAGTQTVVQNSTPDELRGRVLSLYGIVMRTAPAFGALAVGLAADHTGIVMAMLGSLALFAGLLGVHFWRRTVHRRAGY